VVVFGFLWIVALVLFGNWCGFGFCVLFFENRKILGFWKNGRGFNGVRLGSVGRFLVGKVCMDGGFFGFLFLEQLSGGLCGCVFLWILLFEVMMKYK